MLDVKVGDRVVTREGSIHPVIQDNEGNIVIEGKGIVYDNTTPRDYNIIKILPATEGNEFTTILSKRKFLVAYPKRKYTQSLIDRVKLLANEVYVNGDVNIDTAIKAILNANNLNDNIKRDMVFHLVHHIPSVQIYADIHNWAHHYLSMKGITMHD